MSLHQVWNAAQRSRLISQLAATSRAFAAALPDGEAVDGLIVNLHLCLTLELSPAELQSVFGTRVLGFLAGMAAAARSENARPRYAIDPTFTPPGQPPLVKTQVVGIDSDGRLRTDRAGDDRAGGTVHLIFRGRAKG